MNDSLLSDLEARLPQSREDPRLLGDAATRVERLRHWLKNRDLDGVLLSRRDNFAWLTLGGDNHVLQNTEIGVGHLVVTRTAQYLLAYAMDGPRLMEEQVRGQGYELVTVRWHEGDPRLVAFRLCGPKLASDSAVTGSLDCAEEISRLHEPLTDLELDRLRWLGRATALVFEKAVGFIQPGQTEREIARRLTDAFAVEGIELDVLLVGTDSRAERFRHVIPTDRVLERYVLMNPAARRWGLHANASRAIHFGGSPDRLRRAYDDAADILAEVLALIEPGRPFSSVPMKLRQAFAVRGYADGWEAHFPGGITGYVVADDRTSTDLTFVARQAHDWFVTLPGVMIEELTFLGADGLELASAGAVWPTRPLQHGHLAFALPALWERD